MEFKRQSSDVVKVFLAVDESRALYHAVCKKIINAASIGGIQIPLESAFFSIASPIIKRACFDQPTICNLHSTQLESLSETLKDYARDRSDSSMRFVLDMAGEMEEMSTILSKLPFDGVLEEGKGNFTVPDNLDTI